MLHTILIILVALVVYGVLIFLLGLCVVEAVKERRNGKPTPSDKLRIIRKGKVIQLEADEKEYLF